MQKETQTEELVRLRNENAALKTQSTEIHLKVSAGGKIILYFPTSRFPTTLGFEQWLAVLDNQEMIRQLIKDNAGKLKKKGE